jgi:hypothetical protein
METKTMSKDKIKWIGPYPVTNRHADDVTVSDLIRLRKEHQIMYNALIMVTKSQYNCDAKDCALAAIEQIKGDKCA